MSRSKVAAVMAKSMKSAAVARPQFLSMGGIKAVECNGIRLAFIHSSQLRIDSEYQRALHDSRVQKIADSFNINAYGGLIVAERKHGFYILDGQQRHTAGTRARPEGFFEPCVIVSCRNQQEEALAFGQAGINARQLNRNECFKAFCVAGRKDEVTVTDMLLDDIGVTIEYGRGRPSNNATKYPAAFLEAYKMLGTKRFAFMLRVIKLYQSPDYNGIIESDALKSRFVQGLAKYLMDTDESNETILRGLDNGWTAADILDRAARIEHGKDWSGDRAKYVCDQFKASFGEGIRVRPKRTIK